MSSSPTNSEASISAAPSIVSNESTDDSSLKPALSTDSLQTTTETPTDHVKTVVKTIESTDDSSLKPALSTDDSSLQTDAPMDGVQTVLKASDTLSPEAVTSPLEALALACAVEKTSGEEKEFTDNDVLCGRGGLTNNARGNIFFRHLVRMKQDSYLMCSKREKAGVAREIVQAIQSLDPPGRFLKKDSSGKWVEIGERKAREKTSQALREGAPEKRQGLKTNPPPTATTTNMTIADQASIVIGQKVVGQPVLPMTNNPWSFSSNRARVVSDDSVGSILTEQQVTTSGSKRKVVPEPNSPAGPRLKLLKSRVKA